jgi:pyrroline-5-carboxylate reductase
LHSPEKDETEQIIRHGSMVENTWCSFTTLARNSEDTHDPDLAWLRNQITSAGGTPVEALHDLEEAGGRTAISRTVRVAYQRSLELGKEKPVHTPETNGNDG